MNFRLAGYIDDCVIDIAKDSLPIPRQFGGRRQAGEVVFRSHPDILSSPASQALLRTNAADRVRDPVRSAHQLRSGGQVCELLDMSVWIAAFEGFRLRILGFRIFHRPPS
jgi:hypothetical protein